MLFLIKIGTFHLWVCLSRSYEIHDDSFHMPGIRLGWRGQKVFSLGGRRVPYASFGI